MVTEADHIQAMCNRLTARLKAKEAEVVEIKDMLKTLAAVPRVLNDEKPIGQHHEEKTAAVHNKGLADNVRQYVELMDFETAISIPEMIKSLKANAGVKGKDASLYAYIHTLLKKLALQNVVRHEKGVGFYKTKKTPKQEAETELVATR